MATVTQDQPAGTFSITHVPVTATQATITKAAAGAGVRLFCNAITVSLTCAATAQTQILVELLDGATQIWAAQMACLAGDSKCLIVTNLELAGSPNTAMTLHFSGAGVAGSFEAVTLTGYVEA